MSYVQRYYALCPYHQRPCKCSARRRGMLAAANRAQLHAPESEQDQLTRQFVSVLNVISTESLWSTFVPSRIGANSDVDRTAHAVIQAHTSPAAVIRYGSPDYAHSLQVLQRDCDNNVVTEKTLVIASLCCIYEMVTKQQRSTVYVHADGLAALFQARPAGGWTGEVARAIFYSSWPAITYNPMVRGIASPFDNEEWTRMLPATHTNMRQTTTRLRHLAQVLLIRIPRLIAMTRAGRTTAGTNTRDAIRLAAELWSIKDEDAELDLISRARRIKTRDASLSLLIPLSYSFPSPADLETAIFYWSMRLALTRLCLHLSDLDPNRSVPQETRQEFMNERRQDFMHLASTLHCCYGLSPLAQSPFHIAFIPLYGAHFEFEDAQEEWKHILRMAILNALGATVTPICGSTELDIYRHSQLMVGGPLFFVG